MSAPTEVVVTAFTHRGLVRAENEDTVGVGSWLRNLPMEAPAQFRHPVGSALPCLLADGMGGHAGGEEASRIAVSELARLLAEAADEAAVAACIAAAHRSIVAAMREDPGLRRMGTTLVGLLIRTEELIRFNVGDSRLYRVRDGFVRQISTDDVPDLPWRPYDVASPTRSGQITQCLGGFDEVPAPHLGTEPLQRGWLYLLCSDGLSDLVPFARMAEILNDETEDLEKVQMLVNEALAQGGTDNVSVLLVRLCPGADAE